MGGLGLARRRLSETQVSTFSALSNGIDNGAEINVVGDITMTETIVITNKTGVKIYSEVGAVFTSSFTASTGGMFHIKNGSDVTFTGVGFLNGSAFQSSWPYGWAGACTWTTATSRCRTRTSRRAQLVGEERST